MLQTTPKAQKSLLKNLGMMILCLLLPTAIGFLFISFKLSDTTIILLYLFGVVLCAKFTDGFYYGINASVIAVMLFNYFFTDPLFTLRVNNSDYPITMLIMMIISLLISTLTSQEKQSATLARHSALQATTLYNFTNTLLEANEIEQAQEIIVRSFSDTFHTKAAFLPQTKKGQAAPYLLQQIQANTIKHRKYRPENLEREFSSWPIKNKEGAFGLLLLPKIKEGGFDEAQKQLIHSMCACAALGVDRIENLHQYMASQEKITQEQYRSNLLRSISHDLRTPLSGIMGTSEVLMRLEISQEERIQMAQGIYQEASWLYSLVENILNLTRMEEGHLILNKQEALAEEIIEAACSTVEKRNKDRTIQVNIPSEIITVDVDEKLIVQLLVNLLENAIRHTPQENKVEIVLEADPIKKEVRFIVQDEGEGIGKEDLPHIFEPFYTSSQNQKDRARGIGLGLAICRSIAQAHDGELTAHNRCDRSGARFICTLLMTERKDLS